MPIAKKYKYVDLSGYAFTGKHAVIDLLREFEGFCVPHFEFEFNLLRIQGGIRDLETALVDDWSPIRSDAAIRRFRKVVDRFSSKNSIVDPSSWFCAVGWNYEDFFNSRFKELSTAYLDEFIETSWQTNWPYPLAEIPGYELFFRKLKKLCGAKDAMDFEICLAAPETFIEVTRNYLNNLLAAFVQNRREDSARTVVMHNSFEPFNPSRSIRYFHDAKSIVVDRDPRDNYVAGLWYRPTALPPDKFIKRYRLYRQLSKRHDDGNINVLRILFEQLVLEYDTTVPKILDFLGEDHSVHVEPKKYFDPAISGKNVGIWRNYEHQEEIDLIYHELNEYCYES